MTSNDLKYVGFWVRVGAALLDRLILVAITTPVLTLYYGESYWEYYESYWESEDIFLGPFDFLISGLFPMIATICFWVAKQATPGKMAVRAKIVDAKTGRAPTLGQCIGRYFARIISLIPLGMGFIWIAFDDRKQGWHDKLVGTVVVSPKVIEQQEVRFDGS
ncbi:MAG: hypothetical protein M2R45_03709 [Verrucomicrobia subdivision 3 bacterium]|nr:hypothetical protein [Limisphaerales bacterium]MCS1414991.1 hypothetical protein [Limisphaerales bacterium]